MSARACWILLLILLIGCARTAPPASPTPVQGAAIDGSEDPSPKAGGMTLGRRPLPQGVSPDDLKKDAPAPRAPDGYRPLTFEVLGGFPYQIDEMGRVGKLPDGSLSHVPDELKAYDGNKIAVSGYMVPLSLEETRVKDFVLVRNQLLCCFGQTPRMNEWVYVALDKPIEVQLDLPVTVSGKLFVGEDLEGDQVLSLYRMMGERVEVIE